MKTVCLKKLDSGPMVFGQSKNMLFHMLKMLHVNCVNVPFLEGPLLPFSVGISVITVCLVL